MNEGRWEQSFSFLVKSPLLYSTCLFTKSLLHFLSRIRDPALVLAKFFKRLNTRQQCLLVGVFAVLVILLLTFPSSYTKGDVAPFWFVSDFCPFVSVHLFCFLAVKGDCRAAVRTRRASASRRYWHSDPET